MPDHTPGLQHSSVIFYLKPEAAQLCCGQCSRFACVKLIDIREGSITGEEFLCHMCYLCRVILLSANMYGFISTECGKALCMSGGLAVDDVGEQDTINLGGKVSHSYPQSSSPISTTVNIARAKMGNKLHRLFNISTPNCYFYYLYIYIKNLLRSRRSRSAKGRT